MSDPERPDWVEARAQCTAERLFTELHEIVKRDAESANRNPRIDGGFQVKAQGRGDVSFTVLRLEPQSAAYTGRLFILEGKTITVEPVDARDVVHSPLLKAEAILDPHCNCRLRYTVPGTEIQQMAEELQLLSRLALEELFFPEG